jgi:hypothetical protein
VVETKKERLQRKAKNKTISYKKLEDEEYEPGSGKEDEDGEEEEVNSEDAEDNFVVSDDNEE